MADTSIEWTDKVWNPLVGCDRVSPGCDHCYAIGVVHRQMSPQHVGLTVKPEGAPTDWTGEVRQVPHKLAEPLRWRKPAMVFINSLSDVFHAKVPDEYVARIFATMALTPQHTYQLLTKRPQRMAQLLADDEFYDQVLWHLLDVDPAYGTEDDRGPMPWPLPNVWLGTSIETDRYAFRADHLRVTPAAVRFVSAEPLVGPLPSLDLDGIDWLIAGGESGPGARPMHPTWVRGLRDRCEATATAFLFKQWGAWGPAGGWRGPDDHVLIDGHVVPAGERLGMDHMLQPAAMHRWGKKTAGRTLDGRTHDDYPTQEVAGV